MPWPWPFSSAPSPSVPAQDAAEPKRDFGLTDEQRGRIFGQLAPKKEPDSVDPREKQAADELDAFLQSFEAPKTGAGATRPSDDPVAETPSEPKLTPYSRHHPDGTLNIDPVALNPATMSCQQAFDQAFYCQSLGGKFNDIYRFGHVKDCGEQWGAFWFCMRTRTYPAGEKERAVREYYRLRDEKRKGEGRGSSEDVWEIRTEAVKRAFWKDPDAEEEGEGMPVKE
ncbi:hypothetical protein LTR86_000487 [Recurvomyces mirabilis]|nr:hypothetical protein LTR86_000487 [Recurvomyces mirabilis]